MVGLSIFLEIAHLFTQKRRMEVETVGICLGTLLAKYVL